MEILGSVFAELHFNLQTRLPNKWEFVNLKHNQDFSLILNELTYFTAYIAFLIWFVKAKLEHAWVRHLEAIDKCLVAVVLVLSAMHIFWPFLLFVSYFFTCRFYPWVATAVALLLNISSIDDFLRRLCFVISSEILNFRNYIHRLLQNSEESDGRHIAVPVIQPRLAAQEEFRPSEAPVIQPRITDDEQSGPSEERGIQPRNATEETYRPSKTPRIQPHLAPEEPHGLSEMSVIQPGLDSTALREESQTPVNHVHSQRESETPRRHPEMDIRQLYRTSGAPPRSLGFRFSEN
ncbi:hypothetical protein AVEN_159264-1 [Araneus ventricosus]|uniref:Uncharacterized protein n=1 Tax=Araneus ventricosus TaxID=182803 RepID=A0A4Y2A1E0_ARAVE|nr:hypothetical protein AVEN_159264-1 [Araneus ventricosus]